MMDQLTSLASQVGISPETARKGLGALLTFIQGHLGPEGFGKVQAAVPDTPGMMTSFELEKESPGLLGTVSDLAGKLFGGRAGEVADLLSMLSRAGLDAGQIQAFLPKALEYLRNNLPADLLDRIQAILPAAAKSSGVGAK